MRLYLAFGDRAQATARSRALMESVQSEATRNSPRTVTRFFYAVQSTGRGASLRVPEDMQEPLTPTERSALVDEASAIAQGLRPERTPVPTGGGRGGGGRS